MDVFPGFWDWLDQKKKNTSIISIRPIYDELIAGNDILALWAKNRKDAGWFVPVDDVPTQQKYASIATWAFDPVQRYKNTAQTEFLSIADSWLIAKASAEGWTIVTHERLDLTSRKRILIPNVCNAFHVKYINNIELLRRSGAQFHL